MENEIRRDTEPWVLPEVPSGWGPLSSQEWELGEGEQSQESWGREHTLPHPSPTRSCFWRSSGHLLYDLTDWAFRSWASIIHSLDCWFSAKKERNVVTVTPLWGLWLVIQLLQKVYLDALPALKSLLPHVSGAKCVYKYPSSDLAMFCQWNPY